MTKKKNGFFSKIKSKIGKQDKELEDDLLDEEILDDDEEYEDDEEDDDEYEDEDEEVQPPAINVTSDDSEEDSDDSDDEDDEDEEDDVEEDDEDDEEDLDDDEDDDEEDDDQDDIDDQLSDTDKTLEIEIYEDEKPNFFSKLKSNITSKFSKKSDFDDDEFDDEEEFSAQEMPIPSSHSLHEEAPAKEPLLKAMINKFKNIKHDYNESLDPEDKARVLKTRQSSGNSFSELPPDQWLPHLLGKDFRQKTHQFFLIGLTSIFFYQTGKFTAILLNNTGKEKKFRPTPINLAVYNPRMDIGNIKRNNVFNAQYDEQPVKKDDKQPVITENVPKVCRAAEKESKLPLKLLHTVVLQDSVKSVASVSQRGKISSYREGDKIESFAEIGKIDRLKVVFKNLQTQQCEFISNAEKSKKTYKTPVFSQKAGRKLLPKKDGIGKKGNKYTIKKKLRDDLLSNIGEVLTQAKAVQIKNPDGSLAFRMTEIVPGSIYSQLDIQDGDIVTGINGKKFTNLNELMSMFGKLKENDNYDITVKRNGTEQTLNYNFVE